MLFPIKQKQLVLVYLYLKHIYDWGFLLLKYVKKNSSPLLFTNIYSDTFFCWFYLSLIYLDSIFMCDVIKGYNFLFSLTLCTRFDLCCWISVFVCLVAQSWLTLCDPMGCSLPGSSVHGASPGKNTEWVAMPSSRGVFPLERWDPGLLHCKQILYWLSHWRSPFLYLSYIKFSPLTWSSLSSLFCSIGLFAHLSLYQYLLTVLVYVRTGSRPWSVSSPEHYSRVCQTMHVWQAKSLRLCPTLCDPMDCSPPGSFAQGIL